MLSDTKGRIPYRPEERGFSRVDANLMVAQLFEHWAMIMPDHSNAGAFGYEIMFPFEHRRAAVKVSMSLKEWQTDPDVVVITDITTKPGEKKGKGYGSQALAYLIDWARKNNFTKVLATQVNNEDSIRFWVRNGFARCPDPNPTSDYVLPL